ncbi:CHASE domain-containing protein [Pelagerythrobacter marensis]|uniref:histidine kinase n=1 Tax=Pelagerythrobacter marensis TaxID=543877 RepID=A0ABZ2D610_9SPHN
MPVQASRRGKSRRWLVEYPRAAPVAIFLLIAAITALSVFAIERGEAQREAARLSDRARAVASALERRASANTAYLRAGAAMFAAVDRVDEALFDRFVAELQLDFDYRGTEGIGWAQSLRPYELDQFRIGANDAGPDADAADADAAGRGDSSAEGQDPAAAGRQADPPEPAGQAPAALPDPIRIWPAPTTMTGRVVPVTFLRPANDRNRQMLGYDMFSDPARRAAMEEAEATAQPTASGKVQLAYPDPDSAPGFIVYMPVFRGEAGRRVRGFIYSPFNAENFLASALDLADAGDRGVKLYDGEATPDRLLAQIAPASGAGKAVQQRIMVANRPMVVEVASPASYSLSALSMVTLLFGLLVASLLLVVARLVTQQTREDQLKLDWLEEQDSIRNSLTRELNHRVKNTLANILSIVALTRRRSDSLEEFADGLDGRIRAISATHDLLTQSEWGTTPVRAVVEAEMAPHAHDSGADFTIEGPDVELAPGDALTLGLAIHELATNASKYGALSVPEGRVSVTWELEGKNVVRMEWAESGGPRLSGRPEWRGFGLDLIEKIVAHELNEKVELEFPPEGVRCTLRVPVRRPSEFAIRAAQRREQAAR